MTGQSLVRSTSASANPTLVSAARFVIQFGANPNGGGVSEIAFSEMANIVSEVEPAEYLSSGQNGVSLTKQFGKTKPATVELKRGVDQDMSLFYWHNEVLYGVRTARRSCSLLVMDTMNVILQTYELLNAWPSKLQISPFKAGAGDVAVATVTLQCEQITFGGAAGVPT